jgi:hypothetical protein
LRGSIKPFVQNSSYRAVPFEQPQWIFPVHRIIQTISIPVRVAALVPDGIRGGPSTGPDVVIAPAESDEVQVPVVEAACEAERQSLARVDALANPAKRYKVFLMALPGTHAPPCKEWGL